MVKQELNKFVLTPAWNGLKQQMLHLAQFGGSIQVIQGVAGSGKTAFFSLIQEEELGASLVSITVNADMPSEAFFGALLSALGLRPDAKASLGQLISSLRAFVQSQNNERSRTVVAIDDVHLLAEPSIAALISVLQGSTDSGVGLHLLFFSEPGITQLIDGLNLLDVSVHDSMIPSFSPSELKMLLEHFSVMQKDGSISAEQIQAIWADSKGLPGPAINLLQNLSEKTAQQKGSFLSSRGLPIVHFVALLFLCGVLFFAFLWRGDSQLASENEEQATESDTAHDMGVKVVANIAPRVQKEASLVKKQAVNQVKSTSSIRSFTSLNDSFKAKESSVAKHDVDQNPVGSNNRLIKTVKVLKADPAVINVSSSSQKVSLGRFSTKKVLKSAPEKVAELPAQMNVEERTQKKKAKVIKKVKLQSVPFANKWGGEEVLLSDVVLKAHEKSLLEYAESGFTLQIMVSGDEIKLTAYIRKQDNKENLFVYKTLRNNKVLYVLLEGFYADKKSALMAVANLPLAQAKAGAWPKSLRSIHREIYDNRRK